MQFYRSPDTIVLPGNQYRNPMPELEHDQIFNEAEDGDASVYNKSVTVYWIKIVMRIDDDTREDLRDFLETNIEWGKNEFSFTPDPDIDCGQGKGNAVDARLYGKTFSEVPVAPGFWRVTMTLRTHGTGGSPPS